MVGGGIVRRLGGKMQFSRGNDRTYRSYSKKPPIRQLDHKGRKMMILVLLTLLLDNLFGNFFTMTKLNNVLKTIKY